MIAPPVGSERDLLGKVVDGRFRVLRLLGQGGMGEVYEVEHLRLGRRCALKVMRPTGADAERAAKRFAREAHLVAGLSNPHIVEVFDAGVADDGISYIAMELLVGESLERTLEREGRLDWGRSRHIALQLCEALAAAHGRGVIHRDMKPANCFRARLGSDADYIKVLDFGIAKRIHPDEGGHDTKLTETDTVVGTFSYMAVEQISGEACDHRVDLWAVGVILYEMLTGQLPFRGSNRGQVWMAILQRDPAPIAALAPGVEVPPEVEEVIARALAKRPEDRFASAEDLAAALRQIPAPRRSPEARVATRAPLAPAPPPAAGAPDPLAPTELAGAPPLDADALREATELAGAAPLGGGTELASPASISDAETLTAPRTARRRRRLAGFAAAFVVAGAATLWGLADASGTEERSDVVAVNLDRIADALERRAREVPPEPAHVDGTPVEDGPTSGEGTSSDVILDDATPEAEAESASPSPVTSSKTKPERTSTSRTKPTALTCADLKQDARVRRCLADCTKCTSPTLKVSPAGGVDAGFMATAPSTGGRGFGECVSGAVKALAKRRPPSALTCTLSR